LRRGLKELGRRRLQRNGASPDDGEGRGKRHP
jgi:hypothetical protein